MFFSWPEGFERVPDEGWTSEPLEELALKYDTVEDHGWYRNLDRTVTDVGSFVSKGHVVLDYSAGTGILASRLLEELDERGFGILMVDSSPKFLRLALEKLGRQDRVAFRLIRYLKEEKRLQLLQEVLSQPMLDRGVDAIVSTNAIHLYYDLEDTLKSWVRILRSGGRAFIQSGNIGVPFMPAGCWIIDRTVRAIDREARKIVAKKGAYAAYRDTLEDAARMEKYETLRRKYFPPVEPIGHYMAKLEVAGFLVTGVTHLPIDVHVDQWFEFLATYHEGVLGWVGGARRVDGADPDPAAVRDRLILIEEAMGAVFRGHPKFRGVWTYITAEKS